MTLHYIMSNPVQEKLSERSEAYPYLYVLPDVRSAGLQPRVSGQASSLG